MTLVDGCVVHYNTLSLEIFCSLYRGKDSLGEEVVKPYTPTTLDTDVGYFDLVIKVLFTSFLFSVFYHGYVIGLL